MARKRPNNDRYKNQKDSIAHELKVIFKMTDECAEHLLNMEICDRYKHLTDDNLINSIVYAINNGSEPERIYLVKTINILVSKIGSLEPAVNGMYLHDTIYHLYHINNRLNDPIIQPWCSNFYHDYIETNKIKISGVYMLLKETSNNELKILPFEICENGFREL